jgi:phosphohistidine phosphatase
MEIYVVRHAEAEPPGAGGDAARCLTARGRGQATAAGAGLHRLGVRLDRLLASPLVRAAETAAIATRALGGPEPETASALDGASRAEAILAALGGWGRPGESLALVGHQPVLGELVVLAIAGVASSGTALGTGGVARLDFEGVPRPGGGRLRWLLTAEQLACLARSG